jgi:hypothetical protein
MMLGWDKLKRDASALFPSASSATRVTARVNLDPLGGSVLMQTVETKVVILEATQDVQLRRGLVLPPGSHQATEIRTRVASLSDVTLTPSRYEIQFTAGQLANMGAEVQPNLVSETIDVTKFVRLGKLSVG